MGFELSSDTRPYEALGFEIKEMREKQKQSLDEVSGAVEISPEMLKNIESGELCPSEDILLLLISYFGVPEDEAAKLWDLAGYTRPKKILSDMPSIEDNSMHAPIIMMPMDGRILYTDTVNITVNNYGVVMNFMQNGGMNGQPVAISRIGMSKEHAKSVLQILAHTLAQTNDLPKSLPMPKDDKKSEQS